MWHRPCLRCKCTISEDIQKMRYKKLVTHVEPHASAVSLLKRAENSSWTRLSKDQTGLSATLTHKLFGLLLSHANSPSGFLLYTQTLWPGFYFNTQTLCLGFYFNTKSGLGFYFNTKSGLGFYFADWSGFILYRLWSGFLLYRLWSGFLLYRLWSGFLLYGLVWVSHYLKATGDDGWTSSAAQLLLKDLLQQLLIVMIMADKAVDQGTQASLHRHPPWLVSQPKARPCPHNDENTQNGPPKTCLTQQVEGIKTKTSNQGFWLKLTCSC